MLERVSAGVHGRTCASNVLRKIVERLKASTRESRFAIVCIPLEGGIDSIRVSLPILIVQRPEEGTTAIGFLTLRLALLQLDRF